VAGTGKIRVPYEPHKNGQVKLHFSGLPEGVSLKDPKNYRKDELKAILDVLDGVKFLG
jgi:hypothetical protein